MCGRAYETYTEEELELRYIGQRRKKRPLGEFRPNFNLSPTQLSPIILIRDGEIQIEQFRWGLVPFWAKDIKSASKYSLINAKGEEISEKRSYKSAFEKRRCIVPLSGFYEWQRTESGAKRPFEIHAKDRSILSIAGIWEHWKGDTEVHSFSIITCSANSFMEKIHNRMPVILDSKVELEWLDPKNTNLERLKDYLKPCPSQWLEANEISNLVNSPKNNIQKVLEPIK